MSEPKLAAEGQRLAGELDRLKDALQSSAIHYKLLAEALEKDERSDKVEKLGGMMEELVEMQHKLTQQSQVLKRITEGYQYPGELQEDAPEGRRGRGNARQEAFTNWKEVIDRKLAELGSGEELDVQNHDWLLKFKRSVWKIHHPGELMPDEEEGDLMTMTEETVKNYKCPISLIDVHLLQDPVCCTQCRHIYSANAIKAAMQQASKSRASYKCPMAGCQSQVTVENLVCDQELKMALEEVRARQAGTGKAGGLYEEAEEL